MFGRKKMYKKGLADAMQAYEAFGRKQEAALSHMREEVLKGNQKLETALFDLGEDLNGIYDYLTSKEKAALYHLSTPMDIKDLEDEEKRLLLAVLYQLSFDEGNSITDSQRSYIRSIQKYLEITNPQTEADISAVGDIDSLETQKSFLQVVLEFLYLQDSDELSDEQEDFLGYFSVNKKQAVLIEERVSRLFNAVGDKGIAEKYGYVPIESEIEQDCFVTVNTNRRSDLNDNSVFNSALYYLIRASRKEFSPIFETKDYLVSYFESRDTVVRLSKTGEQSEFYYHHGDFPVASGTSNWYTIVGNTIFYFFGEAMVIDIENFEPATCFLQTKSNQPMFSWSISGKWLVYQQSLDSCVKLFDLENKCEVPISYGDLPLYAKSCALSDDNVIFIGEENRNCRYFKDGIFSYNISQKKLSRLCESRLPYGLGHITIHGNNIISSKHDYSSNCSYIYYKSLTDISMPWTLMGNLPRTDAEQYFEDGILYTPSEYPSEIHFIDLKNNKQVKVASSEDGKQYCGRVTFTKIGRLVYYLDGQSLYRTSIDDPMKPVLVFSESN